MKKFLQRCLNPPPKDISEEESSTEYESGTDSSSTQTSSSNTTQSSSYTSSSNSIPNTSVNSKSRGNSVNSGHKHTLKSSSRNCLNYCTNPKPKDDNCLKTHANSRRRRSIGSVNQLNRPIEWNNNPNPNGNGIQINRERRKGFHPNAYNKRNANYALADYVQIAPLPEFHGSEEEYPDTHITRFLRACRINNANIPKAWILLFPITLQGKAAMWYDTQIEGNLQEWSEVQNAFIEAFRSPQHTERLRQQLMKFRQESHETVRAYSERLQSILYNWPDHGIPDVILKGIYMDGFNEGGQDWLLLQQPTSLKEAVKLSLHWEEAQNAKLRRKKEQKNLGLENKGEIFNNNLGLKIKGENFNNNLGLKNKGEIFNNNLGLENKDEIFNNNLGLENKDEFFNNKNLGSENKGEIFNSNLQVYGERCEECEGKGHRLEECPNFLRKKTKIDQMNTMGRSVYMPIFLKRNLNKLRNWINSETGN